MKPTIGPWIRSLAPPDLFTRVVVVGVAAEFVLVQIASPFSNSSQMPLMVGLQVLAVVIAFGILATVYLGSRKWFNADVLRTLLLISIPIAAAVGGMVLAWARKWAGLDPVTLGSLRVATTVMHVSAMTVLLWLAVSGVRLHYARMDELTRENDRLQALNVKAARHLIQLDEAATEGVRTRILEGLDRGASRDPSVVRAIWASALEDIVRPLSRQLEEQAEDWVPPAPVPRRPQRIDWRAACLDGMAPTVFSPVGVLVIVNLIAAPMNLGRNGLAFGVQFVAISALVALPTCYLLRRLADSWVRRRPREQVMAFAAMCALSGLVLGLATLPFTLEGPKAFRFVYLAPIFITIVAFLWGLAIAAQRQARHTQEELEATAEDLAWQVARSKERHRQRRRALAHALHGRVQASLAAGIIEIDGAQREGRVSEALVTGIHNRITASVHELDLRDVEPSPVSVVADKVRATWAGILTLDLAVAPGVDQELARDPQSLMTLNDLIPELVFNCIKHAGARHIAISVDRADYRTLRVTAESIGLVAPASSGEPGLGSRLLNTCAIEWTRTGDGGHDRTWLLLPCPSLVVNDSDACLERSPVESEDPVSAAP